MDTHVKRANCSKFNAITDSVSIAHTRQTPVSMKTYIHLSKAYFDRINKNKTNLHSFFSSSSVSLRNVENMLFVAEQKKINFFFFVELICKH